MSSNDTSAGRAENRRVELIVTGLDLDDETGDNITQYYTMRGKYRYFCQSLSVQGRRGKAQTLPRRDEDGGSFISEPN